jgi:DNA-binding winged helix-turn-helix (wHTH) protein
MQLTSQYQNLTEDHLLLYVKKAIKDQPTILNDLENLIQSVKSKYANKAYLYDHTKKILFHNEETISLSYKEMLFLELLILNRHRLVTYCEIQHHVWEGTVMTDNSLRSLVRNLRKKLPSGLISNLSKTGYRLNSLTNFSYF